MASDGGGGTSVLRAVLRDSDMKASVHAATEQDTLDSPKSGREHESNTVSEEEEEGWYVPELCMQCHQAEEYHHAEGWCHSLQCAFLRGYLVIDYVLRVMESFAPEFEDSSDDTVTARLAKPWCEAEKTAMNLLWQMSTMLRYVPLVLWGLLL